MPDLPSYANPKSFRHRFVRSFAIIAIVVLGVPSAFFFLAGLSMAVYGPVKKHPKEFGPKDAIRALENARKWSDDQQITFPEWAFVRVGMTEEEMYRHIRKPGLVVGEYKDENKTVRKMIQWTGPHDSLAIITLRDGKVWSKEETGLRAAHVRDANK